MGKMDSFSFQSYFSLFSMLVSRMNSTNSFKNILTQTSNEKDTTEEVSVNANTNLGGKKLHIDASVATKTEADSSSQCKDIKQISYVESNDSLLENENLVR